MQKTPFLNNIIFPLTHEVLDQVESDGKNNVFCIAFQQEALETLASSVRFLRFSYDTPRPNIKIVVHCFLSTGRNPLEIKIKADTKELHVKGSLTLAFWQGATLLATLSNIVFEIKVKLHMTEEELQFTTEEFIKFSFPSSSSIYYYIPNGKTILTQAFETISEFEQYVQNVGLQLKDIRPINSAGFGSIIPLIIGAINTKDIWRNTS